MADRKLSPRTRETLLDLQDWIERSDPGATPRPVPRVETSTPKAPLLALSALVGAGAGWVALVATWSSLG